MNVKEMREDTRTWFKRAWEKDNLRETYMERNQDIISQLSGIGKYDSEFIPAQTGENSVETKNLEYSDNCRKIEKLIDEIARMNVRTNEVISQIENIKSRFMLYDRFVRRLTMGQIANKYHYSTKQAGRYVNKGLDEARKYITDDEIREALYG